MKSIPDSLKRIIERNPNLEYRVRGLPNLGENLVNGQFSKEISKIYDAFGLYGNELYALENEKIRNISSRSLGGGSPMRTGAFPLCKEALVNLINSDELSDYPMAAGDEESRKIILEYLKQEGCQEQVERLIEDYMGKSVEINIQSLEVGRSFESSYIDLTKIINIEIEEED